MSGWMIRLLAACAMLAPLSVRADPSWLGAPRTAALRTGNHGAYGRMVLDIPAGASVAVSEIQGAVVVRLTGTKMALLGRPPRNVQTIEINGAEARVTPVAHAIWRSRRVARRLIIDVFDPLPPDRPGAQARTAASPPPPRHPFPGASQANVVPPAPDLPVKSLAPAVQTGEPVSPPQTGPASAPVTPVEKAPLPEMLAGEAVTGPPHGPVALAASSSNAGLSLPLAPETGAAVFRRGAETLVVFDERRPVDLASVRDDPVFGTAQVQLLPAATILRMTLPAGLTVRLARGRAGWTLTALAADHVAALQPIGSQVADNGVRLPAAAPGAVVSVPDPETGTALQVGTQREPGQGVVVARRTPAFTLLETTQGVAVEPISDAVSLRVASDAAAPGFVLDARGGRTLPLDPPDAGVLTAAAASHLTRRWDFPDLPVDALLRRLQAATDDAAAALPQTRGSRRLAAVQAQLALGLDAEAHALATLAATEDARVGAAPEAAALDAVACLLSGRPAEAEAIEDPRIGGTDEVAFWRAVHRALRGPEGGDDPAPDAAAAFAATLPLALAYPATLRDRLLPAVAETMVRGGEQAAAARLLDARKTDASLDYARALLDEAEGRSAPALATLDRLAQSNDRRLRVRAAVRATELRLGSKQITAVEAADALDRLIYAWRGDAKELALRLRVASLRAQSGNWRAALALLRETGGDLSQAWPDQRAAIRTRMTETFTEALSQDERAGLPPLELVSLIEENPDLLPDGETGRLLAVRLADRLGALDLPARAIPVLGKLVAATPAGLARAELGERLAALHLASGDAQAALLALSASTATGLPAALDAARAITFARATAARGGVAAAVATLASVDTRSADEARADLLEAAKDWPGAVGALSALAARAVPDAGALDDDAAHVVLRLASAAAQAGDEPMLARLHERDLPRMPPGKLSEMLALLTERPVQGVGDLPRAAREASAARALPSALSAMAAPIPRR